MGSALGDDGRELDLPGQNVYNKRVGGWSADVRFAAAAGLPPGRRCRFKLCCRGVCAGWWLAGMVPKSVDLTYSHVEHGVQRPTAKPVPWHQSWLVSLQQ